MLGALLFGTSAVSVLLFVALAWRHFVVERRPFADPRRVALTIGLAAWMAFTLYAAFWMFRSTSSTAPLGLVTTPLYSLVVAAYFGLLAWLLGTAPAQRSLALKCLAGLISMGLLLVPALMLYGEALARRAGDPETAAEDLRSLYGKARVMHDRFIMAGLAKNPGTPPDLLLDLVRENDEGFRERRWGGFRAFLRPDPNDPRSALEWAALNPNTPREALVLLARSESTYVSAAVAQSTRTPQDVLVQLSRREDLAIALAVAANPNTPVEALRNLSEHSSQYVRDQVARRTGLPDAVFSELARDESWVVRGSIALNRSAPPVVLASLVDDPDARVRFYLATNPRTPAGALTRLMQDPDEKVRRHASQTLEASSDD